MCIPIIINSNNLEYLLHIIITVPPPGQPIPVRVHPFPVDDSILENKEITLVMRRIFLNHPGDLSGMRAEQLRQWLISATWYNTPDFTNLLKVVAIIQAAFRDGTLEKEIMWQTVVLITKGVSRYFRGIVLVEVLWENVTSLLNHRLTSAITFNGVMQGFQAVRGTKNAALEDKLLQKLTTMRESVLF